MMLGANGDGQIGFDAGHANDYHVCYDQHEATYLMKLIYCLMSHPKEKTKSDDVSLKKNGDSLKSMCQLKTYVKLSIKYYKCLY